MKRYIAIFILLFFTACDSHIQRNKLVFKDKAENVQDSLLKISLLLNKLNNPETVNKGYYYAGDSLFINNESSITSINISGIQALHSLSNFNEGEKAELLMLIKYLKYNEITAGYFEINLGFWLFRYKYLYNGNDTDSRSIVISDDKSADLKNISNRILDNKDKMYLIGLK